MSASQITHTLFILCQHLARPLAKACADIFDAQPRAPSDPAPLRAGAQEPRRRTQYRMECF